MGLELLFSKGCVAPKEFSFTLRGDLNQMGEQRQVLSKQGFDIRQCDVYPVLKDADIPKALEHIFIHRIAGWWHYKEELVMHGVCTTKEFDDAL